MGDGGCSGGAGVRVVAVGESTVADCQKKKKNYSGAGYCMTKRH